MLAIEYALGVQTFLQRENQDYLKNPQVSNVYREIKIHLNKKLLKSQVQKDVKLAIYDMLYNDLDSLRKFAVEQTKAGKVGHYLICPRSFLRGISAYTKNGVKEIPIQNDVAVGYLTKASKKWPNSGRTHYLLARTVTQKDRALIHAKLALSLPDTEVWEEKMLLETFPELKMKFQALH